LTILFFFGPHFGFKVSNEWCFVVVVGGFAWVKKYLYFIFFLWLPNEKKKLHKIHLKNNK
jgi:hypothetical protein